MELQLRKLRKELGYSQADIAELCGVDQTTVSAWEKEKVRLPLEDAVAIADFLKCTLDELAGRDFIPKKRSYFDDVFEEMNEEGQRYLLKQAKYALADPAFQTERYTRQVRA